MILNTKTEYTNPQGNVKNITTYYTMPNTPPTFTGARIQMDQDETYLFTSSDIIDFFADVEGSNPLSIQIYSTPLLGKLKFNLVEVEIGQMISFSDIHQLSYAPPEGAFGIFYSSFKVRVNDDGIAPNPFSDISRIIIDISPLSPPSVQGNCIYAIEGQDYQFQLIDFSNGYQDDNTIEPEQISFNLPNQGELIGSGSVIENPFTVEKSLLNIIQYRPPSGIYMDELLFKVGDNQGLFSQEEILCIFIYSTPILEIIHILRFCFGDDRAVYDDILEAYSNGDGSAIKSVEITFLHSGYLLLLSEVQVMVGQVILFQDLPNLILRVTDPLTANSTVEFKYKVTSDNDIESVEQSYLATVGEVADFDCKDFDEDDFFVFDE